jgi:membrane-associated phospholipid phosphatase
LNSELTQDNLAPPVKNRLWLEIQERLSAFWKGKLVFTVVLNLLFWPIYTWLSHHSFLPVHTVPKTWLDTNVPLWPNPWAFVYMSQFGYVAAVPWLMRTGPGLRRYLYGAVLLSVVSFVIFILYPVQGPRPAILETTGLLALIQQSDGIFNSIPSLHAGFLGYSYAAGWRLFRGRLPWWAILGFLVWGAGILYSTMATKQHWVADLVAGAILGWFADWLVWRGADPSGETSRQPLP